MQYGENQKSAIVRQESLFLADLKEGGEALRYTNYLKPKSKYLVKIVILIILLQILSVK